MSDLRALLAFAAPHRVALAFSGLLMLFESAAALLVPWVGGLLTDAMLRPGNLAPPGGIVPAGVGMVLLGMLGLFVLQALLKFGNTYILIGDRGVRLSGGQQQRLALTRALLKDPPILILDEATAMFDPQGEAEFLQACRDVLRRRTVLLITHRPASLAAADRIVRMEHGRIIHNGVA
jgi:ABC transporter